MISGAVVDLPIGIGAVIAAGAIALCVAVAVASTPTTIPAAGAAKPAGVRTAPAAADPGGYAQLFLGAWLRSRADDETSAQARLAQSMAPDVELPSPAAGTLPQPASVTAVRSTQRGHGAWSVTVAAQYTTGAVRYYAVPVTADSEL
ncbi:hypothetical protein ABZZ74_43035 [Streptomyces sp. NPDC006476]|uniref:hypothetical protein n=1 Tax=Streptomyces sp. NPDC006476 TaxID=3157175 RepID=UPI0033B161B7